MAPAGELESQDETINIRNSKLVPYRSHLIEFNDQENDHSSTNGCRTRKKLSMDNRRLIFVQYPGSQPEMH